MDSDESEDELDIYQFQEKYALLLERCEALQQENEILVKKIQLVVSLLVRCRRQKGFIIKKLDQYNDDWKNVLCSLIGNQSKNESPENESSLEEPKSNINVTKTTTKNIKRKKRSVKDPLAPKKPANPFLQYCLQQRTAVVNQMISSGTAEPSKQEITKQLASNWKNLSKKEKMVYYDKYKRSRERYAVDMHKYKIKRNTTN